MGAHAVTLGTKKEITPPLPAPRSFPGQTPEKKKFNIGGEKVSWGPTFLFKIAEVQHSEFNIAEFFNTCKERKKIGT